MFSQLANRSYSCYAVPRIESSREEFSNFCPSELKRKRERVVNDYFEWSVFFARAREEYASREKKYVRNDGNERWWIPKQFSKDLLIKTIRLFPSISYPEITRAKFTSNNGYTVGFEGKDLADRNSCYRKSPSTYIAIVFAVRSR